MWRHHEGVPDDDKQERVLFAPDALRELCIESGYAMRGSVRTFDLADLEIETPEEELAPEPEEAAAEPAEPKPEAPADLVPAPCEEAEEATPTESAPSGPATRPLPDRPRPCAASRSKGRQSALFPYAAL